MIGSCIELIAPTEEELKKADKIAASIGCRTIYVTPNLVQIAGVARSLSGGKYSIYVMVDYPKGLKYGMDKLKGTSTDFFLADGYDIVLTPNRNPHDLKREITDVHSFMKKMISPHIEVCYTINASLRSKEELENFASVFYKNPPTKIKTESNATVQPTKANLEVHKRNIDTIRTKCTTPIVVSGNINYNTYKELNSTCKIAVSIKQYEQMKKQKQEEQIKREEQKREELEKNKNENS